MTELERLQKEINGKVVWWQYKNGCLLNAICIWPPNGNVISVKPYGHSTEEILAVTFWITAKEVEEPTFCLVSIDVGIDAAANGLKHVRHLAGIPDGCLYNTYRSVSGCSGFAPSCPYG